MRPEARQGFNAAPKRMFNPRIFAKLKELSPIVQARVDFDVAKASPAKRCMV